MSIYWVYALAAAIGWLGFALGYWAGKD